jgi:hypothetical protein
VRGVDVITIPLGGGIAIDDCSGTVLLEELSHGGPVEIRNSDDVRLTRCVLSEVRFSGASGVMERCTVHGSPGQGAPLLVDSSWIVFSRCDLAGGDSLGPFAPLPAIEVNRGGLILTGDGSGQVAAGQGSMPAPAVSGNGVLVHDPRVALLSAGGALPVAPAVAHFVRSVPSLQAGGAPVGGTLRVELSAAAGHPYLIVLGQPAVPVPVPALFGSVWLHGAAIAAVGAMPASGLVTLAVPVPASQALIGVPFTWQAVAGNPAGGMTVSNPSTYVHDE